MLFMCVFSDRRSPIDSQWPEPPLVPIESRELAPQTRNEMDWSNVNDIRRQRERDTRKFRE